MTQSQTHSGEGATPTAPLRRQPRQTRGQQRIETILDAAEQLFAEIGYQATSTNAIAARANTSIGSLYQFFPHKKAILEAAIARYHQEYHELIQTTLTDDFFFQPLSSALDRLLHALIALHAAHGGVRAFILGANATNEFVPIAQQIHQELLDRLEQLLTARAPNQSTHDRTLTLHILYNVSLTLLQLSEPLPASDQTFVISALKTMLIAYLTPLFDSKNVAQAETPKYRQSE
ncbi:MAG TPA: TetR/AcrR family transcriptional regulator [Ktedonobacteraceae bacterium]|jgi:AcrR family transcriptional regulator